MKSIQGLSKEKTQPLRQPFEPCKIYVIEGFVNGLDEINFDTTAVRADIAARPWQDDYEVSDKVWFEVNQLSINQQSKVIYSIIRHVHLCEALHIAEQASESPERIRGTFRGREQISLPLEASGATRFHTVLARVKPLLPKFGLDKGSTRSCRGDNYYPEVEKLFLRRRRSFFSLQLRENYDELVRFIRNPRSIVPEWPEILSGLYKNNEDVLIVIDQIGKNF